MRGWRNQPARHALAAHGVSIPNTQRPAAVPMARPQVSVAQVYDNLVERAWAAAPNSHEAEALLQERGWVKGQIHQEAAALHLTLAESAQLENDILLELGQEPSIMASIVQAVDQFKPRPSPPSVQGVEP